MKIPTPYEHNNRIGIEFGDRRSYIERYIDAKNSEDRTGRSVVRQGLATLAFRYVDSQSRVIDLATSVQPDKERKIRAQQADVDGWMAKINRREGWYPGDVRVFDEVVGDFTKMATDARVLNDQERRDRELIRQGKGNEVMVPHAPPHVYTYDAY